LDFAADLEERPVAFVLGEEGTRRYGETFEFLTGKPLTW
jgi:hypothetical protein